MSRNSMRGGSLERAAGKVIGKVKQNMSFLTLEDIEILEHLATKGDFDDKKAILVDRV